MSKTEFNDRNGKPIYVGDIVQHRLSLNSKRGGPTLLKVLKTKKGKVLLGDPNSDETVGFALNKSHLPYITIFDTINRQS